MTEAQQPSNHSGMSSLEAFVPTAADKDLKVALYNWRREEATKRFKPYVLATYGSKLLMAGDIIDRLVECFHWKRSINELDDIRRETGWTNQSDWLVVHGPSLLNLLAQHQAQGPPQDEDDELPQGNQSVNLAVVASKVEADSEQGKGKLED